MATNRTVSDVDEPLSRLAPSATPLSRATKVSERIASALVEDIIRDRMAPGDRLPNEQAMAERFQVGRNSVREALRMLEIHGMIKLKLGPRGGPQIAAVDPREVGRTLSLYLGLRGAKIEELVQTRLFLEPKVARMAAENMSDEDELRLREALRAEEASKADDSAYIDAANEFHYVLATMTGNRVLDLVATALKDLYTSRIVNDGIAREAAGPGICNEHKVIGEAILAGQPDRAEALMRSHMDFYVERVRSVAPGFLDSRIAWG
ncbi:FadR/GntR family transcriptional regulator [Rhodococcoides kyotonense]|uniref:DNA-binding transcriptional regulator, FadR family n=1 Tax=Rhodococcoides kyotonense TaxID=398843 RepID=A0A239M220_9NOCA|nr:FadR/GntR family transcriptional regulator [Rhodococcus kyotonensis]SNT35994.1 DNA-binding transcriptional regulator, FadR family [Rhodococcus kyotonensis]